MLVCCGATRIEINAFSSGSGSGSEKEIEVYPDPDLDPERGLKWIRIRPNAVDPVESGSETMLFSILSLFSIYLSNYLSIHLSPYRSLPIYLVCLTDSVLAFHRHGMQGRSFKNNEVTQEIQDRSRVFKLVGSDRYNKKTMDGWTNVPKEELRSPREWGKS